MTYQTQLRRSPLKQCTTQNPAPFDSQEFLAYLEDEERTRYHEAGHAVFYSIFGFRPMSIRGALATHDRRTTPCFHGRMSYILRSAVAKEQAQNYAICPVAGIVAESRVCGIFVAELRGTSGSDDYIAVRKISDLLMLSSQYITGTEDTFDIHLRLWETMAARILDQPPNWSAVKEVASDLTEHGNLERDKLRNSIKRGMWRGTNQCAALLKLRMALQGHSVFKRHRNQFDEYLERYEPVLALHTVCDALAEGPRRACSEDVLKMIDEAHTVMWLRNDWVQTLQAPPIETP